jgi:dipeptidyl-peptidase-4
MRTNEPQDAESTDLPVTDFPIEEVARYPRPGTAIPGVFAFSPDDRLLTYLFSPDASLTRQLFAFDPEKGEQKLLLSPPDGGTTEENLSIEEALRRERQRQLELGVTAYAWAKNAIRFLIPLQGCIYVQDGPHALLRKVVGKDGKPTLDAQISPDGDWVAYVQDAEIYVVPAGGGEPCQVTHGARGTGKTHGLAEYIAQEEMGRLHGFWWSPDSKWIAFTEVDETHIPVYRIVHQGKDAVGEGAQEDHRFPFAGEANARVRLGVVPAEGGEPVWMDLGEEEDFYLPRVQWLPDGGLSAQLENREQTRLELVRFDPRNGRPTTLLREETGVWINLHDMFKPLKRPLDGKEGCFIWVSERTGFRNIYLHDRHGSLIRQLTRGNWVLDSIAGVDEERQQVYFTASLEDPTESHLYAVSFEGGEPRRITHGPGVHTVHLDHAFSSFVDVHHAIDVQPTVTLRSLSDGSVLHTIYDQPDPRIEKWGLRPPQLVTLQSRDGVKLYGAIYRPPASYGDGPFPTIVSVYGGPHHQSVANKWDLMIDMRAQYLCSLGFLVFKLDNRGSSRRGLEFEGVIKHDMGNIEVQDQVDGVRWLVDQGFTDPDRVGIYGWSYGGYMSAMCLAQAPDTFKIAVAGAPVSHWDGYDTHYTERYMGTPQSNPEGYKMSSVLHHVEKIRGRLMLVHGLIDENVHFRHTARLVNALIEARKHYDLLLFPDERHMPRKLADRVFMEENIRDYFLQHL